MPTESLAILGRHLSSLRGAFYRPGFENMLVLLVGWILTVDPAHCVTAALVSTGVSSLRHWQAYHRFFSRGGWKCDKLGRLVFNLLLPLAREGQLLFVADDSLCRKSGCGAYGASFHLDAVLSSVKYKNLVPGHCWVVLSLIVRVPWSNRPWAIPLLFRLYIGKKQAGAKYRTKPQLLVEMLGVLSEWLGDRHCDLAIDSGYMCKTVLKARPVSMDIIGAVKSNSKFRAPLVRRKHKKGEKPKRGRPAKRGKALASPKELIKRAKKWDTYTVVGYRQPRQQRVHSRTVQWYSVLQEQLVLAVFAPSDDGKMLRIYVCTNPDRDVNDVLNTYACRWAQECWHRDAKELFGWADSPAWSEEAVLHTAPWVALMMGVLVAWYCEVWNREHVRLDRPWYLHKQNHSFQDILRAARAVVSRDIPNVLTWAQDLAWDGACPPARRVQLRKVPISPAGIVAFSQPPAPSHKMIA